MTIKQIAVLGMPNTGKSTFFNRFTGANASIGNWPGMTVDLMMAKIKVGEEEAEVADGDGASVAEEACQRGGGEVPDDARHDDDEEGDADSFLLVGRDPFRGS